MTDVTILHKDDSSMVVQLSSQYAPFDSISITETKAVILNSEYTKGIELHRLRSEGKNEAFRLNEDEMDALTAAWEEHRATQALAKLKEEIERTQKIDAAEKTICNIPGATLQKIEGQDCWTLTYNGKERVAYDVDELETEVDRFVAQFEADLAEKAWNEEAQIILSQVPEIQVKYYNAGATPHVSLQAPFQYAKWTRGAEEFLQAVKEARDIVNRHAQEDDVLRILMSDNPADVATIYKAIETTLNNVINASIATAIEEGTAAENNNTQPLTEGE